MIYTTTGLPVDASRKNRLTSGFSILEILVILLVIGILAGITLPTFQALRPKIALTSTSQEITSFFQKARMTAIRQNRTVIGVIETELGGESELHNPTGIKNEWLVLKVVDIYGNEEEISSYQLSRGFPNVHFWGPNELVIHGASANTFNGQTLAYLYDGSVASTGALRISYTKDGTRNILEMAVPTQSGIPVVRKFLAVGDRPSDSVSQEFFQETVTSKARRKTLWVWY